ncbi:hypothetical protein [Rufibacter soli]
MDREEINDRLYEIYDAFGKVEDLIYGFSEEYERNDLLLVRTGTLPLPIASKKDGGKNLLDEVTDQVDMAKCILMDMTESYGDPGVAWLRKEKISRLIKDWEEKSVTCQ